MALKDRGCWIIAYDIGDPKRLRRVFRYLRRYAVPVQYSLFYVEASQGAIGRIMQGIEDFIDPREDDVRAYHIPSRGTIDTIGAPALPNGAKLFSLPTERGGPSEGPSLDGILFGTD
ncbi:MAG: CRISPR-associated endonuclease Cas2 [Gammaproteobacteria bacterium]|nr:CRISPR-associated endonuclease Cas2 [Gammaproteobacteria bacterium]